MSDRGGRDDDLNWDLPQRRGGTRRDHVPARDDGPLDEPFAGEQGTGPTSSRSSGQTGRGGARRRGTRQRSGSGSGIGLYGSEIDSNMARAGVAELVGTAILVYAGTTVAVAASLAIQAIGTTLGSLAVPLVFGLTLVALVAAWGHGSGAVSYTHLPLPTIRLV